MVVVLILLLVSAVVLPVVIPAFSHRKVSEAARILQAGLVGARDNAVRANAPRGIRLLPDPTYASSATILAYNRWVPIEPGPDYSNGSVVIWPIWQTTDGPTYAQPFAAPYPVSNPAAISGAYPYFTPGSGLNAGPGQVLMVEQAPFVNNNTAGGSNNPTSWFWNVRVGDKIQIGGVGREYTIVGPLTINPIAAGGANPELFVNDGLPGIVPSLTRQYTDNTGVIGGAVPVEYLYLVNGQDDDNDGYVDSGWNGLDDGHGGTYGLPVYYNGVADDLIEWETEQWVGAERGVSGALGSFSATMANTTTNLPRPSSYTISRRPVPSQRAQETFLPNGVVIDATTWNTTSERSRLPVDPFSKFTEIMVNPNGQVVPTTAYSSPASVGMAGSFYHFWLSERQDVYEPAAQATVPYLLPMPITTTNYPMAADALKRELKGERSMATLFTRSGQIITNSVEFFNPTDVNAPFYDSQLGAREAK